MDGYADARANLGICLQSLGELDEAEFHLRRAVELEPQHANALYNLGRLLLERGRGGEAVEVLQRALKVQPGWADAWNVLGLSWLALGRGSEAQRAFRQAVKELPNHAEARFNLAALLAAQGSPDGPKQLVVASRLRPERAAWRLRAACAVPTVLDREQEADEVRARIVAAVEELMERTVPAGSLPRPQELLEAGCAFPWLLAHHGRTDRELRRKFAELIEIWCRRSAGSGGQTRASSEVSRLPLRMAAQRRIGFVVTGGHEGVFLRCVGGIIEQVDGEEFERVVFCTQGAQAAIAARFGEASGVRVVPFGRGWASAVETIGAAECDVLYHGEVGTDALNYLLPFARLAPVQCTGIGTPTTTGIPAMDFFVSSRWTEPDLAGASDWHGPALADAAGCEHAHYTERLWPLNAFPTWQARIERPAREQVGRGQFGLPDGRRLYVCPQRLAKITPEMDALFGGILRADPHGLIVLLSGRSPWPTRLLQARFARTLPDVHSRIAFVPWQPPSEYYRLLALSDVVLDSRPYGAGTTAFDAFGLHLPTVTFPSDLNVGRYVRAGYERLELRGPWIANSAEEYVQTAVELAQRGDLDVHLRSELSRRSKELFEDVRAVTEHAAFFRTVARAQI